ncbi:hypothetical protein [Enterococcus faecium]|uniref:hypothetical protein n=1 Tax=Enterococcus faecium TaxID=1352 RepID=UPI00046E4339|nr:hypothetical protein [Enterococcus faecium]
MAAIVVQAKKVLPTKCKKDGIIINSVSLAHLCPSDLKLLEQHSVFFAFAEKIFAADERDHLLPACIEPPNSGTFPVSG